MRIAVTIALIAVVWSGAVDAQQPLVGKWSGTLADQARPDRPGTIEMEIAKAEGGKLKGTMTLYPYKGRGCSGRYQLEGTYQDNKIEFNSTGGGMPECNVKYQLVAEGNQLTGGTGDTNVRLRKR